MSNPEFKTPQPAPWEIGDRVKYVGDSQSGFIDSNGETVWSHVNGAFYDVIGIRPPNGSDRCVDPDTGEPYIQLHHGWNTLRSPLDPNGKHEKAIDVESMHDFELVRGRR